MSTELLSTQVYCVIVLEDIDLDEKVRSTSFRRFWFIKALLCIPVMPPLHMSELLVCIQCGSVLVVWFGRTHHHLEL